MTPSDVVELAVAIRELTVKADAMAEDIGEIREDVTEVKKQAKLTNGNVTELQLWRANVEGQISGFSRGVGPLGKIVVGVVLIVIGAGFERFFGS